MLNGIKETKMDFDHRNPAEKEYFISKITRTQSAERIKKELAKCDLVCSNCHRERTHGAD